MKNFLFLILMTLSICASAQFVTIPDTNFRNVLMAAHPSCFNVNKQMDTTCNGVVYSLTVNLLGPAFTSLDGIQYFDNLQTLNCSYKQLTTLPTLPNSVYQLNCNNNQITSLPNLPPYLTELLCENNLLTSLPNLLTSLQKLNCQNNLIVNLPNLPNNLEILNCGHNNISLIPVIPSSLKEFICYSLNITSLPVLPNTLNNLNCGNNHITSLPTLPKSLQTIYCNNNLLINLPTLPDSLVDLACYNNYFTALPSFPDSLKNFKGFNNPFLSCLPILPQSLVQCQIVNTDIQCVPNLVVANLGLPLCPFGSTCEPKPTMSGTVFHDQNNNGIFDIGVDSPLPNKLVINLNGWNATSFHNGNYQIKLDSGIFNTVNCIPGKSNYFNISPAMYTITPASGGSQGTNFNFAVQPVPNIYDLKVEIAKGRARPGFVQWVNTTINNDGTENATTATLKLLKPATFTFLNANPTISQQSGDTLIWNNIDINIFRNKTVAVNWNIPANEVIGTNYQLQAWVIPTNIDTTPLNNHIVDDGTIQGSFDPNDKTVSKSVLNPNAATEELKYTVRFQNTGNDTAFNIMVRDQLSQNLDISTFQMVGASHNYSYQIRDKGLLEVFFQNVLLPDSNINEPLSHGFFQYVINPKPNLTINDSINNTADIYFDFNAPVVTNTVTTKVIVTGVNEVSKINANLYPNPTTGKAVVSISESVGTLTLLDMKGSVISITTIKNGSEIDLTRLDNGIYIGKIETDQGFKILKIVKQD